MYCHMLVLWCDDTGAPVSRISIQSEYETYLNMEDELMAEVRHHRGAVYTVFRMYHRSNLVFTSADT